jgi:hypothetical protein
VTAAGNDSNVDDGTVELGVKGSCGVLGRYTSKFMSRTDCWGLLAAKRWAKVAAAV